MNSTIEGTLEHLPQKNVHEFYYRRYPRPPTTQEKAGVWCRSIYLSSSHSPILLSGVIQKTIKFKKLLKIENFLIYYWREKQRFFCLQIFLLLF